MPPPIQFLIELSERLENAAKASRQTPGRVGNVVHLTSDMADGVVVLGDLHGHRVHFNKAVKAVALDKYPKRHLVLQEVVHGPHLYPDGGCTSHLLLEEVAALKLKYPERVHFLLSNHELSECTGQAIVKGGISQNELFLRGLEQAYGPASVRIHELLRGFIRAAPLAVRLPNGIFICHTTPNAEAMVKYDVGVYRRDYRDGDLLEGGPAHAHVWGRTWDKAHADKFAAMVEATTLVHGHEPCPEGRGLMNDRQIVLDASGAHCWLVLCPIREPLTATELYARMKKVP